MRSTEERIARMHERAAELADRKDKVKLMASGLFSGLLMVCLVFLMLQLQHMHHPLISSGTTGSSMLSESAGGYVMVALAAFIAGVVLTAGIYHLKKRRKGEKK